MKLQTLKTCSLLGTIFLALQCAAGPICAILPALGTLIGMAQAASNGKEIEASKSSASAARSASVASSLESRSWVASVSASLKQWSSVHSDIENTVAAAIASAVSEAKAAKTMSDNPANNVYTFPAPSAPTMPVIPISSIATSYNSANFKTSAERSGPTAPPNSVPTLPFGTTPSSISPGVPE